LTISKYQKYSSQEIRQEINTNNVALKRKNYKKKKNWKVLKFLSVQSMRVFLSNFFYQMLYLFGEKVIENKDIYKFSLTSFSLVESEVRKCQWSDIKTGP
jgi:hypothetical protein